MSNSRIFFCYYLFNNNNLLLFIISEKMSMLLSSVFAKAFMESIQRQHSWNLLIFDISCIDIYICICPHMFSFYLSHTPFLDNPPAYTTRYELATLDVPEVRRGALIQLMYLLKINFSSNDQSFSNFSNYLFINKSAFFRWKMLTFSAQLYRNFFQSLSSCDDRLISGLQHTHII